MKKQLHLICCDLRSRREVREYQGLLNELRVLGAFRSLETTWWLERDGITAAQLRDRLGRFISNEDRLLVVCVSDWAGRWLMATANDAVKAA